MWSAFDQEREAMVLHGLGRTRRTSRQSECPDAAAEPMTSIECGLRIDPVVQSAAARART
jgi:hypothetical protein